jgi:hypothetical protein
MRILMLKKIFIKDDSSKLKERKRRMKRRKRRKRGKRGKEE